MTLDFVVVDVDNVASSYVHVNRNQERNLARFDFDSHTERTDHCAARSNYFGFR